MDSNSYWKHIKKLYEISGYDDPVKFVEDYLGFMTKKIILRVKKRKKFLVIKSYHGENSRNIR